MRKLKLYMETSVWNFFFADDAPEKRDITKEFFASFEKDVYEIFISEVVVREINDADERRRSALFDLIKRHSPAELEAGEEANKLTGVYMERGIVPQAKRDDAFHVAIATTNEMDALVSWNYRHLANLRKADLFNAVNLEMGYTKRLEIITPMEVSRYEG